MPASLTQVEALSSSDAQIKTAVVHLRSEPEPPNLPSCEPREYDSDIWQSLRPFLKSRGYRLVTLRDMAFEVAEATNEPISEPWNGPPKDDDELYCASSVRRSSPLFFSTHVKSDVIFP
jgi:hypothetical protein